MIRTITFFALLICMFCSLILPAAASPPELPGNPKGAFPWAYPPGVSPLLLLPGFVSTGWNERDMAVSTDGREFFFGVTMGDISTIMVTRMNETGDWSPPVVADFARDFHYFHFEPALAPDGQRIYFLTTRPTKGEEDRPGWRNQNIFYSERRSDGSWSPPIDPGPPVNSLDAEYFPSFTESGSLYFTRQSAKDGKTAIYRARPRGNGFGEPEKLPAPVNQGATIYNACVSPDESVLIACVIPRESPRGTPASYQAFFRIEGNSWSPGIRLSDSKAFAECPAIAASFSPDGKFFFFATRRVAPKWKKASRTRKNMEIRRHSPENGNSDIYWVPADFLSGLRPKK